MIVLFAGTRGYADDLSKGDIASFEKGLLNFIKSNHPLIISDMGKDFILTPELEDRLSKAAIQSQFTREFTALSFKSCRTP